MTLLALAMLVTITVLVMSGRVPIIVSLVLTPLVFGLLGGFGRELGPMMLEGVQQLAPTAVMLTFAIWYFCLMIDAGLFDPLLRLTLRLVDHDPVRIGMGTAVLALLVSLDGDSSSTYLICCAALLPLYQRVGLNPLMLTSLLMLSVGIVNLAPWGGPTARISAVLGVDPADVFLPLLPAMLAGAAFVVGLGYMLGRRERQRLVALHGPAHGRPAGGVQPSVAFELEPGSQELRRPKLAPFNLLLTCALMTCVVLSVLPLSVLFMIATAIALIVNYPGLDAQKDRLSAHGPTIMRVTTVVFATGIFIGILNGTGMSAALAEDATRLLPPGIGPHLAPVTAILSLPFTFFMTNDPFFYGVVPVVAEMAGQYGVQPVEIARAALLDGAVHFLSPMIPSTHLLVALAGADFGKHQRFCMPWAILLSLLMLSVAMLTGAVPFRT